MQLSVLERLALLGSLPPQGDFSTLKIVRELREALSFDEEEHGRLQLRVENGNWVWDRGAEQPKDIPIGEKAQDVIVAALKELNSGKSLTEAHLSVYERFVEAAGEA